MKRYQRILFVCDSGTCRSPMAEAILKEYRLNRPMEIESRGLVVLFPEPLNQKVEAVLISNGINLGDHMSAQLTEEDFTEDTLIIVMEEVQREKILDSFSRADPGQVQVLTQIVGDELEILNPYGGPLQSYGLCYETLNKSIKKLAERLNEDGMEEDMIEEDIPEQDVAETDKEYNEGE
ncbi:MAG: phosphotyrosine protein phosphatase [Lachnospiraceae bacterium]|jgi:protein-tyrosine-phosphatase|nr:phosphotyrosine protein phosphatase [Lachnospiraceae bacterium]